MTRRTLLARASLGITDPPRTNEAHAKHVARAQTLARTILVALPATGIALITGPSGAGKSVLLRALAAEAAARRRPTVAPTLPRRTGRHILDVCAPGSRQERLAALAAAGLADATILDKTPAQLSDGQRARLLLAVALRRAHSGGPGSLILLDEFTSPLDRTTARAVARTFARAVHRAGVVAILAAAHDDTLEALAPSLVISLTLDGRATLLRPGACRTPQTQPQTQGAA